MKIWTYGRSPWSGSRNGSIWIKNVNGASRLSNFWNFFSATQMISCYDWWPWMKPCYITMTQRQSNNQWHGSIAAHPTPKKFWMQKPAGNVHQGGLVLAWQCPSSPGTCNPEETGLPGLPMTWSPTLFSWFGPVGKPPVPWTEKTIESSQFFVRRGGHCCRGDLVGRATFWFFLF